MEISGRIKSIDALREVGANNFKVQSFRLDLTRFDPNTGDEYANEAEFQCAGEKTSILSEVNEGDRVKVQFNIQGRDYEKRDGSGTGFAQNLNVFKIEVVEKAKAVSAQDNDLPF